MNDEKEFYTSFYEEIKAKYNERLAPGSENTSYREDIFTETVVHDIAESGLFCGDVTLCQYRATIRNALVSLNGYAIDYNENAEVETSVLELFVTCYNDEPELREITTSSLMSVVQQCVKFYQFAKKGYITSYTDQSSDVYGLAETIRTTEFNRVRIFLLTNYKISEKSRPVKAQEKDGITYNVELVDFTRYWHYVNQGENQSEIIADFKAYNGLPCVYVAGQDYDYDCVLCAIPAQILFDIYQNYGDRLLEANVRSFLDQNGKINKGIRDTIRSEPQRFMAYNNGIVMTAMDVIREKQERGYCITGLRGLQIVNGGQTVASIYFTKQKYKNEVDLTGIRVPAKILVLRPTENPEETQGFDEMFISNVSTYSNSQNKVKTADLSSNHKFHVQLESLANRTYCPDGQTQWFYERGSGKYMTALKLRAKNNPNELKKLKKLCPSGNKITKTEMSRYFYSWAQRPDIVSLGSEKCFARFMEELTSQGNPLPNQEDFKKLVAKAILYRTAHKILLRDKEGIPSSATNVTTYLIALLSLQYKEQIDLFQIWKNQDISDELKAQFRIWGREIFQTFQTTARGRQISEWAKKEECWKIFQQKGLSEPEMKIRELR